MTFDPPKPIRIMSRLLQGINTPHTHPIRLCVKKDMNNTKKRVLKVEQTH